jgi:RNA polymerase sigma-54 factor
MRYFFTGGTEASDGSVTTNESIKQKVQALVENEDKSHPISDDEIVRQLEEGEGVKLARRTVTKYRRALGIPPSRQRKRF